MYLLPDIFGFIDIFVLQTIITNSLLARFAWHKGVEFSRFDTERGNARKVVIKSGRGRKKCLYRKRKGTAVAAASILFKIYEREEIRSPPETPAG
jgi:hypothetical protein